MIPNARLRDALAILLLDDNGLRPTNTALDIILAVIESTNATDEEYTGNGTPGLRRYLADVKTALSALVDNTPVTR